MLQRHSTGTRKRTLLYRALLVVAIAVLGVTFSPLTGQASAAYAPGRVCNASSVSILVTAQPVNGNWGVYSLSAGWCTGMATHDVEAVWGKRCDSSGRCWHVGWKVNGFTTTTVRNGYTMPTPPGRTLFVSGSGSWTIAPEWPRPSLSSLSYDLR